MTGGKISGVLAMIAAAALLSACDDSNTDDASATTTTAASLPATEPSSLPPSAPSSDASSPAAASKPPSALPKVFDNAKMQDAVHQILAGSYRIKHVGVVKCPPNKPVKKGTKFDCKTKIAKKDQLVGITVTSKDGHYDVDKPRPAKKKKK